MNILNIIFFVELVLLFFKILDFTYLFQTKEYRFDRFFSNLKETGFLQIFYLRQFRTPAKSPRNILIMFISLIFLFVHPKGVLINIISLLIFPLISFFITSIAVLMTGIISYALKKLTIFKAAQKISYSKATFIGITGSYGKTTTKEFLYQILKTQFKVEKTEKNMNSEVGVAISILKNLKKDTQFFIAEIGAYKRGEIKTVCDYINPKYGILTAVGNQHFDLFGSQENLVAAKAELLESLPKDGIAYINKDTGYLNELLKNVKCKSVFFSAANDTTAPVVLGHHNISNLLPCIALAQHLKIPKDQIKKAIANLKPITKRLAIKKGINGSTILDDSYNSNVEGFIAAIVNAKNFKAKKTVIISRGIIELGNEKVNSYNKILDSLNKTNYSLFTTDKLFYKLQKNNVQFYKDEKDLVNETLRILDKNILLIIEGKFHPETLKQLI